MLKSPITDFASIAANGIHFSTKYPTDGLDEAPRTVGTLYEVQNLEDLQTLPPGYRAAQRPISGTGTAGGKIGMLHRSSGTATVLQATPEGRAGVAACGNCVAAMIASTFAESPVAGFKVYLPRKHAINVTASISEFAGDPSVNVRRIRQFWHDVPMRIARNRTKVVDGRICVPIASPLNDWILVKARKGEDPLHLQLDDVLPVLVEFGLVTSMSTARIAVIQTEQSSIPMVRFISTSQSNAPLTGLALLMLASVEEPEWLAPLRSGFRTPRGMISQELPKPFKDSDGKNCIEFADLLVSAEPIVQPIESGPSMVIS